MAEYHKLSLAQKAEYARNSVAEPPTRCPRCGIGVSSNDLLAHLGERCEGRAEPHPCSTWLGYRDATILVPSSTLARWVAAGIVRTRDDGQPDGVRYLKRDIVWRLALRLALEAP